MTDQETLLEFPCEFPIKAMGKASVNIEETVLEIVREHAPDVTAEDVRTKASSNGKYVSVTVVVNATSKEQLDKIYLGITDHPDILMAL